jgi:hypothetical protein
VEEVWQAKPSNVEEVWQAKPSKVEGLLWKIHV